MNIDVLLKLLEINSTAVILVSVLLVITPIITLIGLMIKQQVVANKYNVMVLDLLKQLPSTAAEDIGKGNAALINTINEVSQEVSYLRESVAIKDKALLAVQGQINKLLKEYTELHRKNEEQSREIKRQQTVIDELYKNVTLLSKLLIQVKDSFGKNFSDEVEKVLGDMNPKAKA